MFDNLQKKLYLLKKVIFLLLIFSKELLLLLKLQLFIFMQKTDKQEGVIRQTDKRDRDQADRQMTERSDRIEKERQEREIDQTGMQIERSCSQKRERSQNENLCLPVYF